MTPSRALDILIAEKIMGLTTLPYTEGVKQVGDYSGPVVMVDNRWKPLHYYSTNISAAWEVVEKMTTKDSSMSIESNPNGTFAAFVHDVLTDKTIGYCNVANTAPHAICLAALKAKGVEV